MKRVIACLILCVMLLSGCSTLDIDKKAKDLTNYSLNINLDFDTKTAKLKQVIDYVNNEDIILNELMFHLYPNAFKSRDLSVLPVSDFNLSKAYPNGFDAGSINIDSVSVGTQMAEYKLINEDSILSVPLFDKLYPSQRVKVEISADIDIPNVLHRFGYGDDTLNLCNFYPIVCVYENGGFVQDRYCSNGDPFYSEVANYDVQVVFDDCLQVGASGECVSSKTSNGIVSNIYKAKVVRDFGLVFSPKFEVLEKSVNNVCFKYLFYDDDNAEQNLQVMIDAVSTFNKLLGDYPYSTLTAVKSDFIYGGMEYPNLILISDDVENTHDYQNVIVHETGHQWFYGIVGNNEYSEAWLDEGLTEYITAMFYELNPGYGIQYSEVIGNALSSYLLFLDVYEDVFGEAFDTSMNRSLTEFNSEPEYTYLIYVKGVLLLDNLREVVGDSGFLLGLKNFYETNKFSIATTDHFIASMESATNKELSSLIMSWLNGDVVIAN